MLKSYRELKVWKKSYDLCVKIYRRTKGFPLEERYVLTSQIRRSALSIPSNIAEGYGRKIKGRLYPDIIHSLWFSVWTGHPNTTCRRFKLSPDKCTKWIQPRYFRSGNHAQSTYPLFWKKECLLNPAQKLELLYPLYAGIIGNLETGMRLSACNCQPPSDPW